MEPVDKELSSPVPRGCFLGAFVCGVAMLGVGRYLMGRSDDLGAAARIGAVVLLIVGTLLVLPFGIVLGLRLLATLSADRQIRRSRARDEARTGDDDATSA